MMASLIQNRFKICFIFLLLVVFVGLTSVHLSDFSFRPSKEWITTVARKLHSFYWETNIQRGDSNQTLIEELLFPSNKPTSEEQISTTSGLDTTIRPTNQDTMTANMSKAQTYHKAHPRNYHFILDEPDVCEKHNPFLVLMVPVAPHQLEARNSIRSTWGNESVVQGRNVTVMFMLGLRGEEGDPEQQKQLRLESQQHHDLIQSNFKDTYRNLTIKTLLIMDWLATHCPHASYAMKIDSDMFLNVENLMTMLLAANTPKENYMTGRVMWGRPVVRNQRSKWYVPKEAYPENVYPTYLLGMGYVFSNDLPKKLVKVSEDVQPFNIEDAYMGACLKKLGIPASNPPNPSQFKTYYSGRFNRNMFARVITTILGSPQRLVTFWQELKRPT